MAGLSEGSPAILCRYRITANTPPLQGGDAGSTPTTCSTRRSHRTHDVKLGEHGPLVVRCPNVDDGPSNLYEVLQAAGVSEAQVAREDITQKSTKTIPLRLERAVTQYGDFQFA